MKNYKEQVYKGERSLFQAENANVEYCTFDVGESPLKESKHINVKHSVFKWKYPFWYAKHVSVEDTALYENARAAIWYSEDLTFTNVSIKAPKAFRRCDGLTLEHVSIPNAEETLWHCKNVTLKDVSAHGQYFGMNSENIEVDGLTMIGDYSFDSTKNVTIRNAHIMSKDAFWNSENVTVYDSFIAGEYIGWNAKNVTFINCTLESLQGMCYMENLVMRDCKIINTDLAFEYSTIDVEVDSDIISVKNPISGRIVANHIDEIIFDNEDVNEEDTQIIVKESKAVEAL